MFGLNNWSQLVRNHFAITDIVYWYSPLLAVPKLALAHPAKFQCKFSRRWLNFEFLFDWGYRIFHTPAFTLWSAMADPRLVPSDNASQESHFAAIVIKWALADCQMVRHVLSYELFWKLSCTNFTELKSILDD
jgi:hypothetical protein